MSGVVLKHVHLFEKTAEINELIMNQYVSICFLSVTYTTCMESLEKLWRSVLKSEKYLKILHVC